MAFLAFVHLALFLALSPTQICLFTIQLLLGSDGSFALEPCNVKAVFGRKKIGFVEMEPIKDGFQENGGIDF